MVERVRGILLEAFPGMQFEKLRVLPGGKVTGSVLWDGFAEMDDVERQDRLRDLLEQRLGADVQLVGVLLAYTPRELTSMRG